MKKNRVKFRSWIAVLVAVSAIVIDQVIKVAVKLNMYLHESFSVCGDWFYIYFTENKGMAFGMELGGKLFLTCFRLVAVSLLGYYLYRIIRNTKFPVGYIVSIALVFAGAMGNIIDSLFYGEIFTHSMGRVASLVPFGEGYGDFLYGAVVDMFYFPLFSFDWPAWMPFVGGEHFIFFSPIFNFADACISCSIVSILLFYRNCINKPLK
ncbi:MAG: lipoprotein signal peptidase [Bacteroidaceae bacterium]|nr:lipoprotein signal peptidase [Bacteroidaceae bacterium]MBR2416326.1 lipoprotein signal peptidase [Bacteroidaceae bacterium]